MLTLCRGNCSSCTVETVSGASIAGDGEGRGEVGVGRDEVDEG